MNFKVSGVAAGTAFVLSLLLGIIGGAAFPLLLARAVLFAILFFLLPLGIHAAAGRFLPELLSGEVPGKSPPPGAAPLQGAPGSLVDISEEGDDTAGEETLPPEYSALEPAALEPAVQEPEYQEAPPLEPLEEIDLSSFSGKNQGSIDFQKEKGYNNKKGEVPASEKGKKERFSSGTGSFEPSGGPEMVEELPDLDSLAGAFVPAGGGYAEEEAPGYPSGLGEKKSHFGGKALTFKGDYDPKDLAEAIRTKLKRDEG